MSKHRVFMGLVVCQLVILFGLVLWGSWTERRRAPEVRARKALASGLMLTDFSLWTGAPYLRHPSQADLFSPFQDFPSSIEHFPAGSIMAPPAASRGERR